MNTSDIELLENKENTNITLSTIDLEKGKIKEQEIEDDYKIILEKENNENDDEEDEKKIGQSITLPIPPLNIRSNESCRTICTENNKLNAQILQRMNQDYLPKSKKQVEIKIKQPLEKTWYNTCIVLLWLALLFNFMINAYLYWNFNKISPSNINKISQDNISIVINKNEHNTSHIVRPYNITKNYYNLTFNMSNFLYLLAGETLTINKLIVMGDITGQKLTFTEGTGNKLDISGDITGQKLSFTEGIGNKLDIDGNITGQKLSFTEGTGNTLTCPIVISNQLFGEKLNRCTQGTC